MFDISKLTSNIKTARLFRNYSQMHVAFLLNISQNAYSKIENGQSDLSVERLFKLAEIFDFNPEALINMEGPPAIITKSYARSTKNRS